MLKQILSRNIWLYLGLMLILLVSVDWDKCFRQRGRYLLGIFYNGHFQNPRDGLVYRDYLKRHGTDHGAFKNTF
ncbi:MAG: hypothetical protein HY591_06735 [Candidatus Omnitrophica bacterium]|nr:hypothetical protein [Candidatus Omnitrophota bacterium]